MNEILLYPKSGDFVFLTAGKMGRKIEEAFRREHPNGVVEVQLEKIHSGKLRNQTNRIMYQLFNRRSAERV